MFKRVVLLIAVLCGILWMQSAVPYVQRALRIATLTEQPLELPEGLIALKSDTGQRLLSESAAKADFDKLQRFFHPQIYRSFCGVASGVIAKNTLHNEAVSSQSSWFEHRPVGTRLAHETFFGGMSLEEFDRLVESHGLSVRRRHGGTLTLSEFREVIKNNLSVSSDLVVANYHRKTLGQKGGGHFSPLAAFHAQTDRVLVLDVAAHRYPSAWVPVEWLWRAIDTTDKGAQRQRGIVEVTLRSDR